MIESVCDNVQKIYTIGCKYSSNKVVLFLPQKGQVQQAQANHLKLGQWISVVIITNVFSLTHKLSLLTLTFVASLTAIFNNRNLNLPCINIESLDVHTFSFHNDVWEFYY